MGSFAVIARLKRILGKKACVGHAGTLDPFANGLLLVGITREATRLMSHLLELDKKYTVTAQLGVLTDTLDSTGVVLENKVVQNITAESLKNSIALLQPQYTQIPPLYSACKHNGERLHALARSKKMSTQELQAIVEAKKRLVTLHACNLISYQDSLFTLETHVSHGTYIRTLVSDIARNMNQYATACRLERTQIGPWSVNDAVCITKLETIEDIASFIIPVETFCAQLDNYKNS